MKLSRFWYRVDDLINPLHGCDVLVSIDDLVQSDKRFVPIFGIRRIDIFVGDRPFQRFPAEGNDLGLMIDLKSLKLSSIQDDVIALGTDRPNGKCIYEGAIMHNDFRINWAEYENGRTQVSLTENKGNDHEKIWWTGFVKSDPFKKTFNSSKCFEGFDHVQVVVLLKGMEEF